MVVRPPRIGAGESRRGDTHALGCCGVLWQAPGTSYSTAVLVLKAEFVLAAFAKE